MRTALEANPFAFHLFFDFVFDLLRDPVVVGFGNLAFDGPGYGTRSRGYSDPTTKTRDIDVSHMDATKETIGDVDDIGIIRCECNETGEQWGRNCGCEYFDQNGNAVGSSDVRSVEISLDPESVQSRVAER